MAQKRVPELKNGGKLLRMIFLLLRELREKNCLTKIKSQLEMKIEKLRKPNGRKKTKIKQKSRGVPWLLLTIYSKKKIGINVIKMHIPIL